MIISKTLRLKRSIKLFILLVLCFSGFESKADYLTSSDITYSWMDTGVYLIRYRIYVRCDQSVLPAKIVFYKSGGHYYSKYLGAEQLVSMKKYSQQSPSCTEPKMCDSSLSGSLGYLELMYLDTFNVQETDTNLIGGCEWEVYLSNLARGSELTTADVQSFLYVHSNFARINTCIPNNSSPSFLQPYTYIGCAGKTSKLSFQAVDTVDIGDSFSYHLVPALYGGFVSMIYKSPYSEKRPLSFYGWPLTQLPRPYGFYLDPVTGLLEFTPNTAFQVGVVCVEVREWRRQNGTMVQIGKIRKDFYFNVLDCDGDQPPVIEAPDDTLYVCVNDTFRYEIETSDSDGDSSYIDWNAGMPYGSFTTTNGTEKNARGIFYLTPTASQISDTASTFTVTARDNHCVYGRSWSKTFFVYVKGYTNGPQLSIGGDVIDSAGLDSVFVQAQISNSTSSPFEWQSGGDGTFQYKDSLSSWYYLGAQDKKTCVLNLYGEILDPTPCFLNEKLRDTLSIIQQFKKVNAGLDINYYLNDSILLQPLVDTNRAERYVWSSLSGGVFTDSSNTHSLFLPSVNNLSECSTQLVLNSVNCELGSDTLELQRIFIPADGGTDILTSAQDSIQLSANLNMLYQQDAFWTSTGDGYFTDSTSPNAWYVLGRNDWKNCGTQLIWQEAYKNACWTNADTVSLDFSFQTIDAGSDQMVRPLDTVQLGATPALGFKPYGYWTTDGDGIFSDSLEENTTYVLGANDRNNCGTKLYWNSLYPKCFAKQDSLELSISFSSISAGIDQSLQFGDSVLLNAILAHGGQVSGWWTSTGSGVFSDSTLGQSVYYPSVDDWTNCGTRLYWNSPFGLCSQQIDSMNWTRLPNTLDAGLDQLLPQKDSINLSGSGSAKEIVWTSNGTGLFLDSGAYQTTYYSSNSDRQLCSLQFYIEEYPLAKCFLNKDSFAVRFTESQVKFTDVLYDSCFMDSVFVLLDTGSGGQITYQGNYTGTTSLLNSNSVLVLNPSEDDIKRGGVWVKATRTSYCAQDSDSLFIALFEGKPIRNYLGKNGPIFLYPNPGKSVVSLASYCPVEVFEADLYDVQGKFIQSWKLNELPYELNIESLSQGTYFLRVRLYAGRVLWLPLQKNE